MTLDGTFLKFHSKEVVRLWLLPLRFNLDVFSSNLFMTRVIELFSLLLSFITKQERNFCVLMKKLAAGGLIGFFPLHSLITWHSKTYGGRCYYELQQFRPLNNDFSSFFAKGKVDVMVKTEKQSKRKNIIIIETLFICIFNILMMQALSFHALRAHDIVEQPRRNESSYGDSLVPVQIHHSWGRIKFQCFT